MKKIKSRSDSRRNTPWDFSKTTSSVQKYIDYEHRLDYAYKHSTIYDREREVELINSFVPTECPHCQSSDICRKGKLKSGIQRYFCKSCNKRFQPTTNTIFDNHKIPISSYIQYWTNLFRYMSFNAESWNTKNSFTTMKYWFYKTTMLLETFQENIVLRGTVYYDELMFPLEKKDLFIDENGKKLRGNSRNQLCIGVATDKTNCYIAYLKLGMPSQKITLEKFKDHIEKGSKLITDNSSATSKLVQQLDLTSEKYDAHKLKKLQDKNNPLDPVNDLHDKLRKFLKAHSGFNRDDLERYLCLFSFMYSNRNEDHNHLLKVEIMLELAFSTRKTIRFKNQP